MNLATPTDGDTGIVAPLLKHEQGALDCATEQSRLCFEEDGHCSPVLIAIPPEGTANIIAMAGAPKGVAGDLIYTLSQTAAVAFVIEAWFSKVPNDSAVSREDAVILPPRSDPSRREVVMIQFRSGARVILRHAIITRPATGKPTLGPWKTMDCAHPAAGFKPISFGDEGGYLGSGNLP